MRCSKYLSGVLIASCMVTIATADPSYDGYAQFFGSVGYDGNVWVLAGASDYPPWDFIGSYVGAWGPSQYDASDPQNDYVPGLVISNMGGDWSSQGYGAYCIQAQAAMHHALNGWGVIGLDYDCMFLDP